MSLGLDTSIVLRLLLDEPEAQAKRARARLTDAANAGERIFISDLVLAEAFHALVHHYEVPTEEAEKLLKAMLSSPMFTLDADACHDAFGLSGAGFVDRLIASRYEGLRAQTLTFDNKLAKLPNALKP